MTEPTDDEVDAFIRKAAEKIALDLEKGIPIDLAHAIEVCEQALNLVPVLDYGEGPIRSKLLDACQESRKAIEDQWEDVDPDSDF